jgi:hypothetical protein
MRDWDTRSRIVLKERVRKAKSPVCSFSDAILDSETFTANIGGVGWAGLFDCLDLGQANKENEVEWFCAERSSAISVLQNNFCSKIKYC